MKSLFVVSFFRNLLHMIYAIILLYLLSDKHIKHLPDVIRGVFSVSVIDLHCQSVAGSRRFVASQGAFGEVPEGSQLLRKWQVMYRFRF